MTTFSHRRFSTSAAAPAVRGGVTIALDADNPGRFGGDQAAPIWLFLSRWFRNPLRTGSVVPSGRPLAEALARQVDGRTEGMVIELGAGTGIVTEALIDSGIHPERILVVESDRHFTEHLRRRLRGICVVEGNALRLGEIARKAGVARVAAVVSSLPFLFMDVRHQCMILKSAFRLMAYEGPFVQFTYGPFSPVPESIIRRFGLEVNFADYVWLNLPPAAVWRYERIREPDQQLRPAAASNSNAAPPTHRYDRACVGSDSRDDCEQAC